jgi:hypothetical protein
VAIADGRKIRVFEAGDSMLVTGTVKTRAFGVAVRMLSAAVIVAGTSLYSADVAMAGGAVKTVSSSKTPLVVASANSNGRTTWICSPAGFGRKSQCFAR